MLEQLVLLLLLSSSNAQPVDPDVAQLARGFKGCYHVNWGPWRPALHDTGFVAPPDQVQFTVTPTPRPFMKGSFAVSFLLKEGQVPWGAEWKPKDRETVELFWMSRYGGLTMTLRAVENRLVGEAKTFHDHRQSSETASVTAVSFPCPAR